MCSALLCFDVTAVFRLFLTKCLMLHPHGTQQIHSMVQLSEQTCSLPFPPPAPSTFFFLVVSHRFSHSFLKELFGFSEYPFILETAQAVLNLCLSERSWKHQQEFCRRTAKGWVGSMPDKCTGIRNPRNISLCTLHIYVSRLICTVHVQKDKFCWAVLNYLSHIFFQWTMKTEFFPVDFFSVSLMVHKCHTCDIQSKLQRCNRSC